MVGEDGVLTGPFNAMLHNPGVGAPLQALGTALRTRTGLDARVRELVVLLVASHLDSEVEWAGHARMALGLGVPERVLADLEAGSLPADLPLEYADPGRCALALARQLLTGHGIGDDFERQAAVLGDSGVFEVTTLVGYYWTLARQLAVFGVTPHE
jgi:4-carboxymuconolactone decarboxylase